MQTEIDYSTYKPLHIICKFYICFNKNLIILFIAIYFNVKVPLKKSEVKTLSHDYNFEREREREITWLIAFNKLFMQQNNRSRGSNRSTKYPFDESSGDDMSVRRTVWRRSVRRRIVRRRNVRAPFILVLSSAHHMISLTLPIVGLFLFYHHWIVF